MGGVVGCPYVPPTGGSICATWLLPLTPAPLCLVRLLVPFLPARLRRGPPGPLRARGIDRYLLHLRALSANVAWRRVAALLLRLRRRSLLTGMGRPFFTPALRRRRPLWDFLMRMGERLRAIYLRFLRRRLRRMVSKWCLRAHAAPLTA